MTDDVDKVIACLMPAQVLVDKCLNTDSLTDEGYEILIVSIADRLARQVRLKVLERQEVA